MINYDSWGLRFNMLIGSLGALGLDLGVGSSVSDELLDSHSQTLRRTLSLSLSLTSHVCYLYALRCTAT